MIRSGNHISDSLPPDMQIPDPTRWLPAAYEKGVRGPPSQSWMARALLARKLHTTTTDTAGPEKSMQVLHRAAIDPQGLSGGRLEHKKHLGVHVVEHSEDKISGLHEDAGSSTAATTADTLPGPLEAGAGAGMKRFRVEGVTVGPDDDFLGGSMKQGKRTKSKPKDPNSAVYKRGRTCARIAKERGVSLCAASRIVAQEHIPLDD